LKIQPSSFWGTRILWKPAHFFESMASHHMVGSLIFFLYHFFNKSRIFYVGDFVLEQILKTWTQLIFTKGNIIEESNYTKFVRLYNIRINLYIFMQYIWCLLKHRPRTACSFQKYYLALWIAEDWIRKMNGDCTSTSWNLDIDVVTIFWIIM
jgi:hypothetical protein